MRKFLLTLTAVLALTVASKYMTVQAEEMVAQEPQAAMGNMVNAEMNAMNEMNEMNDMNEMNEMNETAEDSAPAAAGMTQ